MKKLTIQFDGYEIGEGITFCGCKDSVEMIRAVALDYFNSFYYEIPVGKNNDIIIENREIKVGDILFDYETGTRWKVVEAK